MKKKIEKILRSYFVDQDKDDHWGTLKRVDQLMKIMKEDREIIKGCAKEQSCSMCKEYLGRTNL
jgi:ribosomal protein L15E